MLEKAYRRVGSISTIFDNIFFEISLLLEYFNLLSLLCKLIRSKQVRRDKKVRSFARVAKPKFFEQP